MQGAVSHRSLNMRKTSAKKAAATPASQPAFDLRAFLDTAGLSRKILSFRAVEIIYSQGDPAKGVYYIQKGGAKLTVINAGGKEAVLAILGTMDFFGEGCMDGQLVWMGTATAPGSTSIWFIEKEEIMPALHAAQDLS